MMIKGRINKESLEIKIKERIKYNGRFKKEINTRKKDKRANKKLMKIKENIFTQLIFCSPMYC